MFYLSQVESPPSGQFLSKPYVLACTMVLRKACTRLSSTIQCKLLLSWGCKSFARKRQFDLQTNPDFSKGLSKERKKCPLDATSSKARVQICGKAEKGDDAAGSRDNRRRL